MTTDSGHRPRTQDRNGSANTPKTGVKHERVGARALTDASCGHAACPAGWSRAFAVEPSYPEARRTRRGARSGRRPESVEAEMALAGDAAEPLARLVVRDVADDRDLARRERLRGPFEQLEHGLRRIAQLRARQRGWRARPRTPRTAGSRARRSACRRRCGRSRRRGRCSGGRRPRVRACGPARGRRRSGCGRRRGPRRAAARCRRPPSSSRAAPGRGRRRSPRRRGSTRPRAPRRRSGAPAARARARPPPAGACRRAATTARQAGAVADIRSRSDVSMGMPCSRERSANASERTSGVKPLASYSSALSASTTIRSRQSICSP